MSSDPPIRVSVIVPAFNHEQFIEETLNSVFAQNFDGLEIILVDDGSSDQTAAIAEQILRDQPRPYRVIRQKNQGAHAAINNGISLAHGEYISLLNSDDRYLPGRISTLFEYAMRTKSRFLITRNRYVDAKGHPLPDSAPHNYYYKLSLASGELFPSPNFELLRQNYAVSTGNFFFHRSLFEQVGPFRNYKICHDWDFILRALLVEDIAFVNKELYEYRKHENNTIRPSLDELRYAEMDEILSNYLSQAETASNPLAPCRKNWGPYWNYFLTHHMLWTNMPRIHDAIQAYLEQPAESDRKIEQHLISAIERYEKRLRELTEENRELRSLANRTLSGKIKFWIMAHLGRRSGKTSA